MSHPESRRRAPLLAVLLAGAGLASMLFAPTLLPTVAVAAVALLASAAAARRRSRGLAAAIAAVSLLLAIGLGGAWSLRTSSTGGLAWTLLVVFVVPLPLVPWLYWLSFENGIRGPGSGIREEKERSIGRLRQSMRENPSNHVVTTAHSGAPHPETGSRTPVPGRFGPDPGPRSPVPGSEGGR